MLDGIWRTKTQKGIKFDWDKIWYSRVFVIAHSEFELKVQNIKSYMVEQIAIKLFNLDKLRDN